MIRYFLILVLVAAASGCLEHRGKHSILRLWADYNSLGQPALFLERLEHQPYKAARVDYFRWMYNKPPGKSDNQLYVTSIDQIDDAGETPYASDSREVPPVPPPEAVESPSLETEPSVNPLPPMPGPIRGSEHPLDGPTAEEPSDHKLTSHLPYRATGHGYPRGGNSVLFDRSRTIHAAEIRRPVGSGLIAPPPKQAVEAQRFSDWLGRWHILGGRNSR